MCKLCYLAADGFKEAAVDIMEDIEAANALPCKMGFTSKLAKCRG